MREGERQRETERETKTGRVRAGVNLRAREQTSRRRVANPNLNLNLANKRECVRLWGTRLEICFAASVEGHTSSLGLCLKLRLIKLHLPFLIRCLTHVSLPTAVCQSHTRLSPDCSVSAGLRVPPPQPPWSDAGRDRGLHRVRHRLVQAAGGERHVHGVSVRHDDGEHGDRRPERLR